MKKLLLFLKRNDFQVPVGLGKLISHIPFKYRPGIGVDYNKQKKAIVEYEHLLLQEKRQYIFNNFFSIFSYAYNNVPFYTELYKKSGITLRDVTTFEDISKLPIISKQDLMDVPLEFRSSRQLKNAILVNTGGSSGKPLAFYMDAKRFGNEWAHIHYIWGNLGFRPNKLRLKFDGRNKVTDFVQYDFVRNMFRYNIYEAPDLCAKKLTQVLKKHKIEYLHGYPSAIYNFAVYCREHDEYLLNLLRKDLKGAFLVSEYPNPYFRSEIENTFDIPTLSSYGHTETCIMAYEKSEKFRFHTLQTYGYAEAIQKDTNNFDLIGTSYFNFASPLIRYNTEDIIGNINNAEGILTDFMITNGRNGEYIVDKVGKKIPLTGLVFGRHHKLFDICKHIQIRQVVPGKATILFVSDQINAKSIISNSLFDASNVQVDFEFEKINEPILSKSGKVNLLVK